VTADEEPKSKNAREGTCLLLKVEVMGMSIGAELHFSMNKSMIHYIKKNEDMVRRSINTSAPSSVKISSVSHSEPLLEKMEKALCVWLEDESQKRLLARSTVVRKKAIIHFYKTTMQAAGEEEDSF
jgi:hypothetical protein